MQTYLQLMLRSKYLYQYLILSDKTQIKADDGTKEIRISEVNSW